VRNQGVIALGHSAEWCSVIYMDLHQSTY